jgi:hypothetical protein
LRAAEDAQAAAQQAHQRAEAHAALLRTVSLIAIGVFVVALLWGAVRRHV